MRNGFVLSFRWRWKIPEHSGTFPDIRPHDESELTLIQLSKNPRRSHSFDDARAPIEVTFARPRTSARKATSLALQNHGKILRIPVTSFARIGFGARKEAFPSREVFR